MSGASGQAVFPAEAAAVPQAREKLRETLERLGVDPSRRHAALLLLSEVVTNAIKHGSRPGDRITVAWTLDRDLLNVAVVDSGSTSDQPTALQPDEEQE